MSEENNPDVQRVSFPQGRFIFLEGDRDAYFYIVEEGRVEIFSNPGGKHVKIAEVGPGESFGEFALLDGAPRSASARAMTEVQLVKVSQRGYEQMLQQIPGWASSMLKSFASRLKSMNEKLIASPQFLTKK